MTTALTVIGVGVVAVVIVAVAIQYQKAVDASWSQAAETLGVRMRSAGLFGRPKISGVCEGCHLNVDVWSTGGKHSKTFTRYRAAFPQPLGLGLRLTKQNFLSGIAQFFGSQDLKVGDHAFDASVVVQGKRPEEIAAFLTPSRRLRIQRIMTWRHHCEINDRAVTWSANGLELVPHKLVANARQTVELALHLASEVTGDASLDRVIQVQERGELDEALQLLEDSDQPGQAHDAEAQVLKGDILYTAGRYEDAATVFHQAELDNPDDPEIKEWAELATKSSAAEVEAPKPLPSGAAIEEICQALFDRNVLSYEATRLFEQQFRGSTVAWSGILRQVTTISYDLVFGRGEYAKATLEIGAAKNASYDGRSIRAIAAFPKEQFDALQSRIGETLHFQGTLVKCDPFMRNLFVADTVLGAGERSEGVRE